MFAKPGCPSAQSASHRQRPLYLRGSGATLDRLPEVIAFAITATRTYFDAEPSEALVQNARAPHPIDSRRLAAFLPRAGVTSMLAARE